MQPNAIDLMQEQVRVIYRAATGSELIEPETQEATPAVPVNDVALRFADLEAMVRSIPSVAQRVPPYSFVPLVNLIEDGPDWLVEVAVPGATAPDVSVEISGQQLVVSGARRGSARGSRGFLQAEIPRGPFRREIELPLSASGEPRIEVHDGIIAIRIAKS